MTTLIDILWEDWIEHREGGRSHGQRILEQADNDIEQWRACVENIPDEPASGALIRDLFLDPLFLATNAVTLLDRAWSVHVCWLHEQSVILDNPNLK